MELDTFLAPVEIGNPSGIELRNDGRFHAIERLMEPASRAKRLESVKAGGTGSVAVDWADILGLSAELAPTGRDLRLLVIVTRALANTEGFDGLASGLTMLANTVENFWDTVHPALRDNPSPREAAVRRINALYQIENKDNGLMSDLEFAVVLNPRGLGAVTGGDLAAGLLNRNSFLVEIPEGLNEKERTALIAAHEARVNRVTAACRAQAAEQADAMADLTASIMAARTALTGLEDRLTAHVGENGIGVKFKEMDKFLGRVHAMLASVQGPAPAVAEAAMPDPSPAPYVNGTASPAAPAPAAAAMPGQVTSRADVEKLLGLIIDFYERTEPSSPIPHLARRMRKMVPMNFLQLMEEIAPSGMKEFKNVAGVDDKAK